MCWPKSWPHNSTLNRRLKEGVREEITNHSLRHAQKRLHRSACIDSVLSEALLGHELGSSTKQQLEAVYGGDYPKEKLLEGARKIWDLIDQLPVASSDALPPTKLRAQKGSVKRQWSRGMQRP